MNLYIIPSKSSQTQKAKYCTIPFIGNIQNRQIKKDRKVNKWLPGAEGWGGMGSDWIQGFFWDEEKVLELENGDGYTTS